MSVEQAIKYLSRNTLLNIDMLEAIKRNDAEIVQCTPEGVLLYLPAARLFSVSARSAEVTLEMMAGGDTGRIDTLLLHRHDQLAALQEAYPFDAVLTCHQAAYLDAQPLPEPSPNYPIRQLGPAYLDFVLQHYSLPTDAEYIQERLNAGMIYGAFVNDSIAGFIGTHQEGSIGMLEVLPGYRRVGVGVALQTFLTNHFVASGLVPFGQVTQRNKASLELQKKLGYQVSRQKVVWLEARNELADLHELIADPE